MKPFFTLLFGLFIAVLNAQTYPWLGYFYNELPNRGDLLDSSVAANHYHSMTRTLTQFNKKGTKKKRTDTFFFSYDDKGFMTTLYKTNSKNKKNEKYEYTYKDSFLVGYKFYKNDKLVREYQITRNNKHKITDIVKKNSKDQIILKQHCDFDEKMEMLTRIAYYDKNNKEKKAIEYSYYEGDNMKQAKEYRNGKLKKVWNYTCEPKGTDEKKIKEIKVCKNVSADENGNRVESNRIVNPKGEVELRVNTFDRNERMIKQQVYDDLKHILRSEFSTTLLNNGNERTIYKSYTKKGKNIFMTTVTHNNFHKIIDNEYSTGRKLKLVFKTTFDYNDKHLLTHSESFDSKKRKVYDNIHIYN